MDREQQRRIIEALVIASPEPITSARLAQIAPECTPALAGELIEELNAGYLEHDCAFEIWKVAGGHQLRTRAEFSGYLQQLRKERPLRLSRAALEGLAIIAYKQPVTRGEIDDVRGVDTGAVVKSLMDRQLVRIVGQKEVPGRPMLYGTTRRFLEVFGLESLKKLPTLRELEEIAREAGLAQEEGADEPGEGGEAAEAAMEATPTGQESDAQVEEVEEGGGAGVEATAADDASPDGVYAADPADPASSAAADDPDGAEVNEIEDAAEADQPLRGAGS